jgi:hypothetical protein
MQVNMCIDICIYKCVICGYIYGSISLCVLRIAKHVLYQSLLPSPYPKLYYGI